MRFFKGHQKTAEMNEDMSMDVDPEFVSPSPVTRVKPVHQDTEKNAHLKGRKRFNADLDDLKGECIVQHGFKVKSRFNRRVLNRCDNGPDIFSTGIRAGDDEGSIEVTICNDRGEHVLVVNLLVSGECRDLQRG
jgi:ubiquitin-conjugating enzyme E2 Q